MHPFLIFERNKGRDKTKKFFFTYNKPTFSYYSQVGLEYRLLLTSNKEGKKELTGYRSHHISNTHALLALSLSCGAVQSLDNET
jgi:hypothetical protein